MQLIIEKSFHPRSRPLSRTHDDDDNNKIYFPFLYFPFLSFTLLCVLNMLFGGVIVPLMGVFTSLIGVFTSLMGVIAPLIPIRI